MNSSIPPLDYIPDGGSSIPLPLSSPSFIAFPLSTPIIDGVGRSDVDHFYIYGRAPYNDTIFNNSIQLQFTPTLDTVSGSVYYDGRWSITIDIPPPGVYTIIAEINGKSSNSITFVSRIPILTWIVLVLFVLFLISCIFQGGNLINLIFAFVNLNLSIIVLYQFKHVYVNLFAHNLSLAMIIIIIICQCVLIILLCWSRLRSTNSNRHYHLLMSHDNHHHQLHAGDQPNPIKQQWKRFNTIKIDDYSQKEKQTIRSIYQYVKKKLKLSPEREQEWENFMTEKKLMDPIFHNFFLENPENTQQLAKQIFREVMKKSDKDTTLIHYCGDGQAKHLQTLRNGNEFPHFSTHSKTNTAPGKQFIIQKIDPQQVEQLIQQFWDKEKKQQ